MLFYLTKPYLFLVDIKNCDYFIFGVMAFVILIIFTIGALILILLLLKKK